jgi:Zn-dependent protease with chaperone function
MKFIIHKKERRYYFLMIAVSLLIYGIALQYLLTLKLAYMLFLFLYPLVFFIFFTFTATIFMGQIRGNAIRVSQNQFPEIYDLLQKQSEKLELKSIPAMYILQGNGILNAFAMKFFGRNCIVLYSNILAALQEGRDAVEFIIGHELGHIQRKHVGGWHHLFLLPAKYIPILSQTYSRACEYTCDSIGYRLCPQGAEKGILILTAGKHLYNKINIDELLVRAIEDEGFTQRFAEIFSTHPHLVNRIRALNELKKEYMALDTGAELFENQFKKALT